MFLQSIWNNPYLQRERQSARPLKLLAVAVTATYVAAALGGVCAWLLAGAVQSPSGVFSVSIPAYHWLHHANAAQAFARGLVGGTTLAIWALASGISPVLTAVRRSREIVSGQADLVAVTKIGPTEVALGSIFSSLLWVLGAIAAALPLFVLGHTIGPAPGWTTISALTVATLIVGCLARGAVGFASAQKCSGRGSSIVLACALGWIVIPGVVLLAWMAATTPALHALRGSGISPEQAEAAFWIVVRSFGLAAMSLMAVLAFAWAFRSSETRGEPEPEGERPKVVIEGPRFDIVRGPSLWKMGDTGFERIIFEPKARKAADLPPDTEGEG